MINTNKVTGFIGTYTKSESKGIYSFVLDLSESKILDVKLAATVENPTYLAISNNNQYLYSIAKAGEAGGVAAYSIAKDSRELNIINTQLSDGAPPCYISVDSKNKIVFTANYHKGTVESFLVSEIDGAIHKRLALVNHEGSGPDKRQEKPHLHYAAYTPDEQYIVAVDLGTDQIITYTIDNNDFIEESKLTVKSGSGPRHLVFHPTKQIAYIMTEFSSEIITVKYDPETGSFTERQAVPIIPKDFTENNQGSAIHISSDGKFVYAGNRGHNSIAVFSVNQETGELTFVESISTTGDWPRDFALDPTESYIVASNQNSNTLVLYSRDKESGRLRLIQKDIKVPEPVCVKFLNL